MEMDALDFLQLRRKPDLEEGVLTFVCVCVCGVVVLCC